MDIGQRLKEARLEKGLSQRQLCGDMITRNMLSQIENGSARPSMDTLRYLAEQLDKPMAYFLEEQAVSPNQKVILAARRAFADGDWQKVLTLLEKYADKDTVFDSERYLLEALALKAAAEQALEEGKDIYARELLDRSAVAGERTPYYTPENERKRLLLMGQAQPELAQELVSSLPDSEPERILRARAALALDDPEKCVRLLTAESVNTPQGQFLLGEGYLMMLQYEKAAEQFQKAEKIYPRRAAEKMEICFREMGDYKMAYYYATKLRQTDK